MNKAIILIAHFKVKIKIKLTDDSFKLPKKIEKKETTKFRNSQNLG